MRKAQTIIPENAMILATVKNHYLMDYTKNNILNFYKPAICSPSPGLPLNESMETIKDYLKEQNVFYIMHGHSHLYNIETNLNKYSSIWEDKNLELYKKYLEFLEQLKKSNHAIYNDGEIIVYKL